MKINYDKNEDVLLVHEGFKPDETFKGNIDLGDIILDLSTNGRVVGIEIMNASEFFNELGFNKELLSNITDAKIKATITKGSLIVFLELNSNNVSTKAQIAAPLAITVYLVEK